MKESHLKMLVLKSLEETPSSGYGLAKTIKEKTAGYWKPSFGALYPLLKEMLDKDMVEAIREGRKKVYSLTSAGKAELSRLLKEKNEMIGHIEKGVEVFAAMHGKSKVGVFYRLLEDLKQGKMPLSEVQPEAFDLRIRVLEMYSDGRLKRHKTKIKAILRRASAELGKLR